MDLKFSKVTRRGPITIVTLSRPEVYNALHTDAHFELNKVFDDFVADPEQVFPLHRFSSRRKADLLYVGGGPPEIVCKFTVGADQPLKGFLHFGLITGGSVFGWQPINQLDRVGKSRGKYVPVAFGISGDHRFPFLGPHPINASSGAWLSHTRAAWASASTG